MSRDTALLLDVTNFHVGNGPPVTYPSQWFIAHPKMKPEAILTKPDETETVDSAAFKILQVTTTRSKRQISAVDMIVFLRLALAEDRIQLKDDWVSFGTTIGHAGETISPLSLLDIRDESNATSDETSRTTGKQQNVMLALLYIVGGFTLTETSQKFNSEVETMIAKYGGAPKSASLFESCVEFWTYKNPYLRKLFAAMDMFYHKFPKAKYHDTRVGTKRLRFEGCGALQPLNNIVQLLDVPLNTFAAWIVYHPIKNDLTRLMASDGDETTKEDSYMPYHLPLGICGKSPYSAATNPDFYVLAHMIGCFYHVARSIHAKMLTPQLGIEHIMENAVWILYQVDKLRNEDEASKDDVEDRADLARIMKRCSISPFKVPRANRLQIVQRWAAIPHPRAGTIGKYLKDLCQK